MILLALSADWVTAIATAALAVGTIISLIFLYKQLKEIKSSVQSSTYLNLYEQMLKIDRFFYEHPELKPYFYDDKALGRLDENQLSRLDSAAEMMMDFFDMAYHQKACMPPETIPGFENYMNCIFQKSPIMKNFIVGERATFYPKQFISELRGEQQATLRSRQR